MVRPCTCSWFLIERKMDKQYLTIVEGESAWGFDGNDLKSADLVRGSTVAAGHMKRWNGMELTRSLL